MIKKKSIKADIDKMQIFDKIKYDLKGHSRSVKMTFLFKIYFFFNLSKLELNVNIVKTQSLKV